jgi:LytS/YehU family sensor histidine kinase
MLLKSIVETAKIVALLMVFAYLIIKHKSFKRSIIGLGTQYDQIILGIFYGLLSVLGISSGHLVFNNLYIQSNLVGPLVGGIMFGPVTGLTAGFIGGLFRLTVLNGNTISDFLITVLAGIIGSFYYRLYKNKRHNFLMIYIFALLTEVLSLMGIVLTITPQVLSGVYFSMIGVYMTLLNPIGVVMLVSLSTDILYNQNLVGANYAEKALRIAQNTLEVLEHKLKDESVVKLSNIIYRYVPLSGLELKIMSLEPAYAGNKAYLLKNHEGSESLSSGTIYDENKEEYIFLSQGLTIDSEEVGLIRFLKPARQTDPADKKLIEGIGNLLSLQIQNSLALEQKKMLITSEYNALRAQVNPHFLYNTLNAIKTLIRIDSDKAQSLIMDLALFYRKRLSKNEEYISVLDEFKTIMVYTNIQTVRFGNRLQIVTELAEDIFQENIPSFILQPIVENAILHGTSKSDMDQVNEVSICGNKVDDDLVFKIQDTGDGFPKEVLEKFYEEKPLASSSIGLYNIKKRLRSIYDENFEFTLENSPTGAYVFLKIPLK